MGKPSHPSNAGAHCTELLPADKAFLAAHAAPTIFLAMRYDDSVVLEGVTDAARRAGRDTDLTWFAPTTVITPASLLVDVVLCLRHSQLAIVVLEDVERRDCDANVMVELGFALGLGRRCLLLVEDRFAPLPSVLAHRFIRRFDAFDVDRSVESAGTTMARGRYRRHA